MTDRLVAIHQAIPGSTIVLDNTGVGRPVADLLTARRIELVPVSITSGKAEQEEDGIWYVPKRELVRGLVTALETGMLRIAKGLPFGEALKAELQDFRVTLTAAGNDTYGGKSEHDDLVIAVALAVWGAGLQ